MKLTPTVPLRIHLSQRLSIVLAALGFVLLSPAARGVAAQSAFRTSLTATISRLPADTIAAGADSLACRRISLHWRELAGARRYLVYTSDSAGGSWVVLPNKNACGSAAPEGSTGLSDVRPTAGASVSPRKVRYKVVALAGDGPHERTLDTTSVVTVELR
jgi:hypothetical protein